MDASIYYILFGILIGVLLGTLIARTRYFMYLQKERKSSTITSRSVILGEVYEKILPALPDFPYAPKDMTFIGKGVDYIIFDGLSGGNLREIIFLELKSGKSQLNHHEKMIQQCIRNNKVRFSEYRIGSVRK